MTSAVVRSLVLSLLVAGAAGCLVPTPQEPEPGPAQVAGSDSPADGDGGTGGQVAAPTSEVAGDRAAHPATTQTSEPAVGLEPSTEPAAEVTSVTPVAEPAEAAGQATVAPEAVEPSVASKPSEPANPATTVAEMPAESAAPLPEPSQPGEAGTSESPEAPSDPAAQAVREVVRSYYQAYGARNWIAASELFWDTATVTSLMPLEDDGIGVVVLPADEYFARVAAESSAAGPTGISRLAEMQLQAAGRLAQAWCHYGGSYGEEEDLMKWHRFDAFTLLLHEDTWKIAALVVGPKSDRGPKTDRP